MKNAALTIGITLIFIALATLVSNPLFGSNSLFRTDFLGNLIHLLSGAALVLVVIKREREVSKAMRILGFAYLVLAIIGALSTGFSEYNKGLGLIALNGPDQLLHLTFALLLLVLGTKELRLQTSH